MSDLYNNINESSILDLSCINDEGKEILIENYSLKEKLETLQKEFDKKNFGNEEKIKELENKVSHLTESLNNANQTIQILKNVENKEDRQIKEMIEKMRQKITDLEAFNFSLKKENAEFLTIFENLNKTKNQEIEIKQVDEEDDLIKEIKSKDNDSINSEISFSSKTPEEIKNFFNNYKKEKEEFYENAVNIITENEIEIETYKSKIDDYRNLIKTYDLKYDLLKKNVKNNFNINLPNLDDFEENKYLNLDYNINYFDNNNNPNENILKKNNINVSKENLNINLIENNTENLHSNYNDNEEKHNSISVNYLNNIENNIDIETKIEKQEENYNQINQINKENKYNNTKTNYTHTNDLQEFDYNNDNNITNDEKYKSIIKKFEHKISEINAFYKEKIFKLEIRINNLEAEKISSKKELEKFNNNKKKYLEDIEYYCETNKKILEEKEKLAEFLNNKIETLAFEIRNMDIVNTKIIECNNILEKEIKDLREKNDNTITTIKENNSKDYEILDKKYNDIFEKYKEFNKSNEILRKENLNLKQLIEGKKIENEELIGKRKVYKEKKKNLIESMNEKLKIYVESLEANYVNKIEEYEFEIKSMKTIIENKIDNIAKDIDVLNISELNSPDKVNRKSINKINKIRKCFIDIYDLVNPIKSKQQKNIINNDGNYYLSNISIENLKDINCENKEISKFDINIEGNSSEINEKNNDYMEFNDLKNEDLSNMYGIDFNKKTSIEAEISNKNYVIDNLLNSNSNSNSNFNEDNKNRFDKEYDFFSSPILKHQLSTSETSSKMRVSLANALNSEENNNLEKKINIMKKKNSIPLRKNSKRNSIVKSNIRQKMNQKIKMKIDAEKINKNFSMLYDLKQENELFKKEIYQLKEKKDEFKNLDDLIELKNLREKNIINYQEIKNLSQEINLLKIDLEKLEISKKDFVNKLSTELKITEDIAANAKLALGQISYEKDVELLRYRNYIRKLKNRLLSLSMNSNNNDDINNNKDVL
jgi:hypothetical protein